ncbi:MAG: disulfide bond formation protein B [Patescibacteria group bacterium]
MPPYVDTFNQIMALGTIVLIIMSTIVLLTLLFFRTPANPILVFFKRHTFIIAFLIGLGSIAMSLFYSEVIGFTACHMCLIQRVFLYPQALIFGYLLWRPRSRQTRPLVETSLIVALFGSLASSYHLYIENGGSSSLACATGGPDVVSCATIYVDQWGITIPTMALVASVSIIILLLNYIYMKRKAA